MPRNLPETSSLLSEGPWARDYFFTHDDDFFTHDDDFNFAEAGNIPADPNPDGQMVQLELRGSNYPKIFVVRRP